MNTLEQLASDIAASVVDYARNNFLKSEIANIEQIVLGHLNAPVPSQPQHVTAEPVTQPVEQPQAQTEAAAPAQAAQVAPDRITAIENAVSNIALMVERIVSGGK